MTIQVNLKKLGDDPKDPTDAVFSALIQFMVDQGGKVGSAALHELAKSARTERPHQIVCDIVSSLGGSFPAAGRHPLVYGVTKFWEWWLHRQD